MVGPAYTPTTSQPVLSYQVVGPYGPPVPQGQYPSTSNPLSGGGGGYSGGGFDASGQINSVNQSFSEAEALLEADYNNALSALGNQESELKSQADISQQQIGNEYSGALSNLNFAQEGAVNDQTTQLQTGEKTAATSLQQARDLFREIQQANIAQLSGLGISSSSVSEALAERLGIETARRISSVTNNIGEIRQNVQKEIGRINTYFTEKKTLLENTKNIELSKIQQSLIAGLNQINAAKNDAQAAKAQRRFDLLSNAQKAIQAINLQAQQFQESLQKWASSKANALTPFVSDPYLLAQYQNNINALNAAPGMTQTFLPNYGYSPEEGLGYYPGPLKSVKKNDPYTVPGSPTPDPTTEQYWMTG